MNKILLVEDDPSESRLYKRLLDLEGFEVMAIDNGQDSRNSALEFHPDVILMDIMMPKMNGFDALDILHFNEELNKIPVIVFTNLSDHHYEEEALKRGAVRFVTKSQIENKNLVRMIREVIEAYKQKGMV